MSNQPTSAAPEMTPIMTYDSVKHLEHIHWCDLEANSLKTCIAKAHHEHAMKWAGDAQRFSLTMRDRASARGIPTGSRRGRGARWTCSTCATRPSCSPTVSESTRPRCSSSSSRRAESPIWFSPRIPGAKSQPLTPTSTSSGHGWPRTASTFGSAATSRKDGDTLEIVAGSLKVEPGAIRRAAELARQLGFEIDPTVAPLLA